MNQAKIQYSTGDSGHERGSGGSIYHNIKEPWGMEAAEMALVLDPGWIFTKNAIIKKTVELFSFLVPGMTAAWVGEDGSPGNTLPGKKTVWPEIVVSAGPKISRGENYQGLPWVVLDHPRLFTKEHVCAIRTLFWWGNYFSVTLHLKGIYRERWREAIAKNIPLLAEGGFHLCHSGDEWRHELSMDNYLSLAGTAPERIATILREQQFLKLSATAPLEQWNTAPERLLYLYRILLTVLSIA